LSRLLQLKNALEVRQAACSLFGRRSCCCLNELNKIGGLRKDEFETTAQFQTRVDESLKRPIIDKMTVDSTYAFRLQNMTYKYNADDDVMRVETRLDSIDNKFTTEKSPRLMVLGLYPGNRQTVHLAVNNLNDFTDQTFRLVFNFKINAEAAKEGKTRYAGYGTLFDR